MRTVVFHVYTASQFWRLGKCSTGTGSELRDVRLLYVLQQSRVGRTPPASLFRRPVRVRRRFCDDVTCTISRLLGALRSFVTGGVISLPLRSCAALVGFGHAWALNVLLRRVASFPLVGRRLLRR